MRKTSFSMIAATAFAFTAAASISTASFAAAETSKPELLELIEEIAKPTVGVPHVEIGEKTETTTTTGPTAHVETHVETHATETHTESHATGPSHSESKGH